VKYLMAASFLVFLSERDSFGHCQLQKEIVWIQKRPLFAFSVANCGRFYILLDMYLLTPLFVGRTTQIVEMQKFLIQLSEQIVDEISSIEHPLTKKASAPANCAWAW